MAMSWTLEGSARTAPAQEATPPPTLITDDSGRRAVLPASVAAVGTVTSSVIDDPHQLIAGDTARRAVLPPSAAGEDMVTGPEPLDTLNVAGDPGRRAVQPTSVAAAGMVTGLVRSEQVLQNASEFVNAVDSGRRAVPTAGTVNLPVIDDPHQLIAGAVLPPSAAGAGMVTGPVRSEPLDTLGDPGRHAVQPPSAAAVDMVTRPVIDDQHRLIAGDLARRAVLPPLGGVNRDDHAQHREIAIAIPRDNNEIVELRATWAFGGDVLARLAGIYGITAVLGAAGAFFLPDHYFVERPRQLWVLNLIKLLLSWFVVKPMSWFRTHPRVEAYMPLACFLNVTLTAPVAASALMNFAALRTFLLTPVVLISIVPFTRLKCFSKRQISSVPVLLYTAALLVLLYRADKLGYISLPGSCVQQDYFAALVALYFIFRDVEVANPGEGAKKAASRMYVEAAVAWRRRLATMLVNSLVPKF